MNRRLSAPLSLGQKIVAWSVIAMLVLSVAALWLRVMVWVLAPFVSLFGR